MKDHTINREFEYKSYKIKDLKEKIMSQDNLSYIDIIKGYHQKNSNIKIAYPEVKKISLSFISTEITKEISDAFKGAYDNFQKEVADEYDRRWEELIKEGTPVYEEENIDRWGNKRQNLSFEQFLNKKEPTRTYSYKYSDYPDTQKFVNKFIEGMSEYMSEKYLSLVTEFQNDVRTKYPDILFKRGLRSNDEIYKQLPSFLNFSKDFEKDIDFNLICGESRELIKDKNEFAGISTYYVTFTPPEGKQIYGNYSSLEKPHADVWNAPSLARIIPYDKAKNFFEEGIARTVDKISENEWSKERYLFELDMSPVTINLNSKTGKIELLDGYKRVLFNNDENCINEEVPVRVFKNLTDKEFVAELFLLNQWKKNAKDETGHNINMFDRGFLFALERRFGFKISDCFYSKIYDVNKAFKYLSLYDTGNDLTTINNKEQYVNDINFFYGDFFAKMRTENHGYTVDEATSQMFNKEILDTIVKTVGKIRQEGNTVPLTEEMIEKIFNDDLIKQSCKKKKYTSSTYVENLFCDKGLYDQIQIGINGLLDDTDYTKEQEEDFEIEDDFEMASW